MPHNKLYIVSCFEHAEVERSVEAVAVPCRKMEEAIANSRNKVECQIRWLTLLFSVMAQIDHSMALPSKPIFYL